MSVTASPAKTAPSPAPQPVSNPVEPSCRVPLLLLFGTALLWLFAATIFELIASLKFHNPHFLADDVYLTYGRVRAAHAAVLLYGFGVPAALGVGLWLLCRLGRAPLAAPGGVIIGALFWNTSVLVGLGGILCGDSPGFDSFEMPYYVSVMLFVSFLLIATCAVLTFHQRTEARLYPSQWFVLGSLFWFPWIFSTAAMLLFCTPVRGVMQPAVAWWFGHNLSNVFLGFAGLAPIFYFIPKLLDRPLHSYYLAAFAFWTLALFGGWGGMPQGAPLPSWIPSLSLAGTVLTAVPILAVFVNFRQTVGKQMHALDANVTLRFIYVALGFWMIAGVQQIVGVFPAVSRLTSYTWFGVAHWQFFHYGFFAFAMFGAIYYIVPRLLDNAAPPQWSAALVNWHFRFAFAGVLISYLALIVAGVGQGLLLDNVEKSFDEVVARTLMPFRLSTLGDLFIVISVILFLLNFALMLLRHCCCGLGASDETRKERA